MLAVILAILVKLVVSLKLGLRDIWSLKNNKSHIFKHLHSTATYFDAYNSLCFKIIDKANSKFDLKIKSNFFVLFFFCFFFIYYFHFHYLWLSVSFTVLITLRYYFISLEAPCITSFCFIYCFHYLYTNYRHILPSLLQSLLLHLIVTHLVIDFVITM